MIDADNKCYLQANLVSLENMEAKEIMEIVGLLVNREADRPGEPGSQGRAELQCTGQVLLELCTMTSP